MQSLQFPLHCTAAANHINLGQVVSDKMHSIARQPNPKLWRNAANKCVHVCTVVKGASRQMLHPLLGGNEWKTENENWFRFEALGQNDAVHNVNMCRLKWNRILTKGMAWTILKEAFTWIEKYRRSDINQHLIWKYSSFFGFRVNWFR